MILYALLIAGGSSLIIATGVFLFGIRQAPLGVEDENGFNLLENSSQALSGEFDSTGGGDYSNPATDLPLSAL